jgi:major membrane immunogen (membrane-anchored lipoprotein)
MKKISVAALLLVVLCSIAMTQKTHYKDGTFSGESQSKYTNEPYWGQATIEIRNDKIIKLTFQIVDKEKNEVFGPDYEQHFKGNDLYLQQCRNDLKGINSYFEKYMKTSNLEQVDAITGATWSYNIFKDAIKVALEKAKNN